MAYDWILNGHQIENYSVEVEKTQFSSQNITEIEQKKIVSMKFLRIQIEHWAQANIRLK